ncbi:hypothetical protein PSPO_a0013 [Pseudoalteromonas spongiae UST010723-006]|nr:hypothetical protein PSPO_a0013 [Pseudoalteromonas spongiae UST010723-006]
MVIYLNKFKNALHNSSVYANCSNSILINANLNVSLLSLIP